MTVYQPADATVFRMHGSSFTSYTSPTRGQTQLCAWRLDIEPGQIGTTHQVSHEEVLLVLAGSATVVVDTDIRTVTTGEVIAFPASAWVRISTEDEPFAAWVTTTAGLTAITVDGERIQPPWAN